ncbi:MAG: F0F1 ATP synthase subunit B [Sporomusaceae bacterium]|nr:F0F1 ATP synthase subunit B [Sporomusaceae bacterium]
MFDLNATLIAQIINFLILLFILKKVAWKPLISAIEARQAKVARDLDKAEQDRLAAEQMRNEYQQQLQQARADAQAIVDKAMKLAEATKQDILDAARAEHERLMTAARDQIARERQQALEEIRGEVVGLSLAAAAKIIGQGVDEKVNAKLVDDFINQLDENRRGLPC